MMVWKFFSVSSMVFIHWVANRAFSPTGVCGRSRIVVGVSCLVLDIQVCSGEVLQRDNSDHMLWEHRH